MKTDTTMKRIFLIGYMGAGKTTIGKELSRLMSLSFIDLDAYIEARYYKTVPRLLAEKSEDEFRQIEQKMLHEVALFENVLISTGGGTPCFFDNMSFMNEVGQTVYLKVSPEELTKRLEPVKHTRPLLKGRQGDDLLAFVEDTLEKRSLYYMQANIVFNVETMLTANDVSQQTNALKNLLSQ
jgi:shikimate kinase